MQPPLLKEKGFRTVGFMDPEEGKGQEGRGDLGGHLKARARRQEMSSGRNRHKNGRRALEGKNIGNKDSERKLSCSCKRQLMGLSANVIGEGNPRTRFIYAL